MEQTKPRHRWLQFTLREFLLVFALAAAFGGWYVDHRRTALLTPVLTHMDAAIAADTSPWIGRVAIVHRGHLFEIQTTLIEAPQDLLPASAIN